MLLLVFVTYGLVFLINSSHLVATWWLQILLAKSKSNFILSCLLLYLNIHFSDREVIDVYVHFFGLCMDDTYFHSLK